MTLHAGKLVINIHAANGLVIFKAECDGDSIDLPLTPEAAQGIAVRLMVAIDEAEADAGEA